MGEKKEFWDITSGNISQMVSAGMAMLALVVGLFALGVAWHNYRGSIAEQKNKLSADAMLEWSRRQPVNTRPCLELMSNFEENHWKQIVERQPMELSKLKGFVLACLSDQDPKELPRAFDKNSGQLSSYGSFLLASRANEMLDADSFIAGFLLKKIGDQDMLKPIGDAICRDDASIIGKLPNIKRLNESFLSLRQYVKTAP